MRGQSEGQEEQPSDQPGLRSFRIRFECCRSSSEIADAEATVMRAIIVPAGEGERRLGAVHLSTCPRGEFAARPQQSRNASMRLGGRCTRLKMTRTPSL